VDEHHADDRRRQPDAGEQPDLRVEAAARGGDDHVGGALLSTALAVTAMPARYHPPEDRCRSTPGRLRRMSDGERVG
jgi:hypothetical protein